jgi:hypothetical protein
MYHNNSIHKKFVNKNSFINDPHLGQNINQVASNQAVLMAKIEEQTNKIYQL